MTAVLTFIVIGLAVFAWVCMFKIVPACTVSLFRYRLWPLRDELTDGLRLGAYEDREEASRFLALIEGTIELAPEISALNLLLRVWASRGASPARNKFDPDALPPEDRTRITPLLDAYTGAVARRVILGTPSGWIVLVVGTPFVIAWVLRDRFRNKQDKGDGGSMLQDVKLAVREEVDLEPAVALIVNGQGRHRRHRHLYQSV